MGQTRFFVVHVIHLNLTLDPILFFLFALLIFSYHSKRSFYLSLTYYISCFCSSACLSVFFSVLLSLYFFLFASLCSTVLTFCFFLSDVLSCCLFLFQLVSHYYSTACLSLLLFLLLLESFFLLVYLSAFCHSDCLSFYLSVFYIYIFLPYLLTCLSVF